MLEIKDLFFKKKILIYGLGKSGLASYKYLKNDNNLQLYDEYKKNFKDVNLKKLIIKSKDIHKEKYDAIIISPGIDIYKCQHKIFLVRNIKKIYTDLDIFYSKHSDKKNITITGTNGKSTTTKLLFDILKYQKKDVRLTGNIGNPILKEKNINKKTIFIIEASSYQLEYSKNFKANYAAILNISPDHLERHKTYENYINSKFKLFKNLKKKDYAFFDKKNSDIIKKIKKKKLDCKIIGVEKKIINKYLKKINNLNFSTEGNKQNLSFVISILKKFRLKKKLLIETINRFKGLKYRQEIIFRNKKVTIINDSKATSFSASINILRSLENVYWIVGGIPKKGDKFILPKNKCLNFKAYIFGKNKNFFVKHLKNKIRYVCSGSLQSSIKKIIKEINLDNDISNQKKIILFSPAAASFDQFKNFEERGKKFNTIIKKLYKKKVINV